MEAQSKEPVHKQFVRGFAGGVDKLINNMDTGFDCPDKMERLRSEMGIIKRRLMPPKRKPSQQRLALARAVGRARANARNTRIAANRASGRPNVRGGRRKTRRFWKKKGGKPRKTKRRRRKRKTRKRNRKR